jgi:hypothetical protein
MTEFSRKVKWSKNDEQYTPKILVEPILKYINLNDIVWCPFDTETSEFVINLQERGIRVVFSHISLDQDFFTYEPEEYTCIVSNPPFSLKFEVLERLYTLNKPFAMLLGLPILNYQQTGNFFLDKELQLLIVDKKVSFNGNTSAFNCSYFCYNFLPKDIIFTHLEHNNTNKDFKKSRMKIK